MSTLCSVNERGQVQPCDALARTTEFDRVSGKGVRFHRLTDLLRDSELHNGRSFVSVRSGEFAKKGIILNFCPFCGSDIGSHMAEGDDD